MDLRELEKSQRANAHPWELARKRVVIDLLRSILPKSPNPPKTILDIGCGDAWLVFQLALFFPQHRFVGYDINFDSEQLNLLKKRYQDADNLILYRSIPESEKETLSPDVVLLLDVIEHIEDDIIFLKGLQGERLIVPHTKVLITVPAYQKLFCSHDTFLGHYRRYTVNMLKNHLNQAKLETARSHYFFASLLPPRWLKVRSERSRQSNEKQEDGIANWEGGLAVTRLITSILFADYFFGKIMYRLGVKMPGLSVFAVGQMHSRNKSIDN